MALFALVRNALRSRVVGEGVWGSRAAVYSLWSVAPTPGVKGFERARAGEVIAHIVPGVHFQLDVPGGVITVPA